MIYITESNLWKALEWYEKQSYNKCPKDLRHYVIKRLWNDARNDVMKNRIAERKWITERTDLRNKVLKTLRMCQMGNVRNQLPRITGLVWNSALLWLKKIKRSTRAGGVWWSVGSDSAALSKSWKRFRSHSVFTMTFRSHCWVLESKFENFHKLALAVIDQIWKSVLAKAVVGKKLI